jgi:hypothetical protein
MWMVAIYLAYVAKQDSHSNVCLLRSALTIADPQFQGHDVGLDCHVGACVCARFSQPGPIGGRLWHSKHHADFFLQSVEHVVSCH